MYAAHVDATHHTFNTSGSLWRDAMVMIDDQTKTLWSQVDGRAIKGPLKGKQLTMIPFTHTNFSEFKQQYPNGKLLKKPEQGKHNSHYDSYFADPEKMGIFGRKEQFDRLPPKDNIFGIRTDNFQIAVTQKRLGTSQFVVLDKFSPPIVLISGSKASVAKAVRLTEFEGKEYDRISVEEGTVLIGGEVTTALESVPLTSAFWFAWASFFPETELIQ